MPRNSSQASRPWSRALVPLIVVVIAGAIATALLVFMPGTDDTSAAPPSATPSSTPKPTRTNSSPTPAPTPTTTGTIAVLGDSFVKGVGSSTDYVSTLGTILGVDTVAFGETGTGLVNYGQGQPYDQRLASVLYTKPAGLVVQASVNDYETSTDAVVAAASTLVTHAHSLDRDLPIAIVGPIYLDSEAQPAILSQRAALKAYCRSADVTYVDPTGWITDATKFELIGSDNLHPTSAGYTRIAEKMAAALEPWAAELP